MKRLERNGLGDVVMETKEEGSGSGSGETISCDTLVLCVNKQCDADTFAAINDAGLVYDGGIVVDHLFRTTDRYVFAFGPFTRFSRKYKDAPPHSQFNIREASEYLCRRVLETYLDPSSPVVVFHRQGGGDKDRDRDAAGSGSGSDRTSLPPLPVFRAPKSINTRLPGKLMYFRCSIPNYPREPAPTAMPTATNNGVCVVKVDQYGTIVELVYCGSEEVEFHNLSKLVGLHEATLHAASYGYEEGEVNDWIEYFREGWMTAILHDRYPEFAQAVKESLDTDKGTFMAIDEVLHAAARSTDDAAVLAVRKSFTGERYEHMHELTKKSVEAQTVDFIKQNKAFLAKYFTAPSLNKT